MTSAERDPAVLELYKTAVEMADRVSARRLASNTFFLATQTGFVTFVGLFKPAQGANPWWVDLVMSIAGILLSLSWWMQLRSYRDLNAAKFDVIMKIEQNLPVRVFGDEWTTLKRDPVPQWRGRYAELGLVERIVPWVFCGLYLSLFIAKVTA
ncbi:hypothetical protein [Actinoplanes sp. DH11]|uniref:RipA family octameric membrane protein n=1 Tax=Actinoplanes sp. DH11 TaxID=2857011 RepID=UPI001E61F4EC|nr:hypothetical protein [Actinoplanes sp. DH11]